MGRFGVVHNGAGYFDPTSFVLYRIQSLEMRRINARRGYFAQKPKTVIKGRFDLDYLPKICAKKE